MGNCLAKPPKHERINEFNHLLSDSVHVYNGKKINHMTSSSDLCWKEEETPRFQFSDFLGDKLLSESPHSLATTVQSSNASSSPQNQDEKRNDIDNQWPDPSGSPEHNAWDTARSYIKGESALELRLAKNQLLSPLSMGDDFRTLSDFPNLKEDLNRAFESSFSDGVVWAEIDRPKKVTAIAMSRNENWQDPTNNISGSPLLFAIATDDGTIALMEVLDEKQIPWSGMKCTGNNSFELSSDDDDGDDYLSCRKFGAQVELPLVGRIRSLDFSPDGKYLAVGGDSCVAYLVAIVFSSRNRLADLKIVQKLERVDRVYAVRFSLDSKYLAIGGFDSAVTVATVNTSLVINQSPTLNEVNMPGLVFCLDWGESHLAVGVSNGFTIFDRNNEMVKHFHRPSSVETIKWSPCGAFLAVGDIEVIIYENKTFESRCVIDSISRDSKHFKYRITSLCWSPCATFLAIGETDGTCLVVETKSFALVHKVCRPYLIVGLAWGQQRKPNGEFRRYLGVGDDSCQVVLIKAGEETNGSLMLSMEVSSEASTIFSKASDWVLRDGVFRDVEDVLEPPRRSQPDGAVIAVAFSRCRKRKFSSYMAYVAEDCSLTIASTRDWNPILVSMIKGWWDEVFN
jgi:WD40 repeat protein